VIARPDPQASLSLNIAKDTAALLAFHFMLNEQQRLANVTDKTETKPYQVFISYSRKDTGAARNIAALCNKIGLNAWLDEDLLPGENWQEGIEKALEACTIAIVLISSGSSSSQWTRKEWSALCEQKWKRPDIEIIPIKMEDAKTPPFLCRYETISAKDEDLDYRLLAAFLSKSRQRKSDPLLRESSAEEVKLEIDRLEERVRDLKRLLENHRQECGDASGS